MVGRQRSSLSVVHQCRLLGISRSSVYYRPVGASQEDLELMREIDRQYMLTPFYGSRRIVAWLKTQGYQVNRKRVQRLMRTMGLEAIYRRPRTSQPVPGHKVYRYLLRGVEINRVNQAWTADITYIPMAQWLPLCGGYHGLVQQVCTILARVQHSGGRLLCGCS